MFGYFSHSWCCTTCTAANEQSQVISHTAVIKERHRRMLTTGSVEWPMAALGHAVQKGWQIIQQR